MNVHERMIARIDAVLPKRKGRAADNNEDFRVLRYIRGQLKGIDKRPEDYEDVSHLHEVAKSRLKSYENQEDAAA